MSRGQSLRSWLLVRSGSGLATMGLLTFVVFIATQGLPSDPARVVLGPEAPESSVATLRAQLGLDLPLTQQYAHWLGAALSGDMGRSLSSGREVDELVGGRLLNTLSLVSGVLVLTIPSAIWLGVVLAVRQGTRLDRAALSLLIGLKALPVFAIAIGLMMLLSTSVFSLLPAVSLLDPSRSPWSQAEYLILPILTLVLSTVPYLARLVRTATIEVLSADYVVQARLRGIPERRLLLRHVLPNAAIPAIQGIALTTSVMLGGTLVVEVMFNYPGLGSLLNSAVEGRDLPIIQASVLLLSGCIVLVNLAADLLTALLTPKLRRAARVDHGARREPAPALKPDHAPVSSPP